MNARPIRTRLTKWIVPTLALCFATCSPPDGPGSRVVVRDSAGIRIVENGDVAGTEAAWTVAPEPILRIGWAEGDPQFQYVRSGFVGRGGRVVVGDMASNLVYLIAPGGGTVTTVGGSGEGPGEIARLESVLGLGGDSIFVADGGNRRVTLFEGPRHLASRHFENIHAEATYGPARRLSDGAFVLLPTGFALRIEPEAGWRSYPVLRTTDFVHVDTVAIFPMMQMRGSDDMNPLYHLGSATPSGGAIAYARSDRAEVTWLDAEGNVVRIARWDETPRPAGDDDWRRYEEAYRERLGGRYEPRRIEESLRDRREDFGGTLPLFRSVHGDPQGNVWLGEYRLADPTASVYRVISSSGEWVGSIGFPGDIQILDITSTRVLGVETDELDVQAVVLYALRRTAGSG